MSATRLVFIVVLTLLAQLLVVPRIAIGSIRPDLTVMLVVLVSLRVGPVGGPLVGFFVGLIQDLLVPPTLGAHALAKSIVGWGIGKTGSQLSLEGAPLFLGLVAFSVLVHDFVYLAAATRGDVLRLVISFATVSLPSAIYTGVVAAAIAVIAAVLQQNLLPGQSGSRGIRGG